MNAPSLLLLSIGLDYSDGDGGFELAARRCRDIAPFGQESWCFLDAFLCIFDNSDALFLRYPTCVCSSMAGMRIALDMWKSLAG